MRRSVCFHPAALLDADGAAAWYAERSIRAAGRFLDELEHLIELIAESPEAFPVYESHLRRALFRRFPFHIVFRADNREVVVLAVAHAKRRPRFWLGRT